MEGYLHEFISDQIREYGVDRFSGLVVGWNLKINDFN